MAHICIHDWHSLLLLEQVHVAVGSVNGLVARRAAVIPPFNPGRPVETRHRCVAPEAEDPLILVLEQVGVRGAVDHVARGARFDKADVVLMTPDGQDIRTLLRKTARLPIGVGQSDQGTRWEEAGWWLVPLVAVLSLAGFRRLRYEDREELS